HFRAPTPRADGLSGRRTIRWNPEGCPANLPIGSMSMGTFRQPADARVEGVISPMIRRGFDLSEDPDTGARRAPLVPQGVLTGFVHAASITGCIAAWHHGSWVLVVLLWMIIIWCNHAALTLLHEAGHGTLTRVRILNEAHGMLIGFASLIPLNVYRYVHARHHAHLGRERDPEFWPYNLPCSSRALRLVYAWLELTLGWIVTPLLYSVRTARSWSLVPRPRRRWILLEWAMLLIGWPVMLVMLASRGWLDEFTIGFLIPALGAGSMQTIRKFTEHLGMHGDTIMTMTRTVEYRGWIGRALSRSQRHVDHHGTHHRYARIPFHDLPEATRLVHGNEHPTFRTHLGAFRDMLPHLLDPRVGPQWRASDGSCPVHGSENSESDGTR
ncbi:MAG: fatty acid desaturase, partial [Phycisphaerales bacterium]|nr:fatty acid desaturase [Phycisphaerales bacterium]